MTNDTPQFATAEYKSAPGGEKCKSCGQDLGARYYRISGALACERCAERLKLEGPKDSHAALVRGLLFGFGGAIAGLILYAGFSIITGIQLGYVALAVGFIVAKAILLGTKGIGGRRYQVAAVLLTYAAVSLAAIPIAISQYKKARGEDTHHARTAAPAASTADESVASGDAAAAAEEPVEVKEPVSMGSMIVRLTGIGLASPFLELQDPVHGVIGLVILFVGIRIAWQMTASKAVEILGPFSATQPKAG
ncbi:MAG TPA: hypothetical protein VGI16_05785 [Candidatus Acidoferrum sp.]|jgi:hypothetical protein